MGGMRWLWPTAVLLLLVALLLLVLRDRECDCQCPPLVPNVTPLPSYPDGPTFLV